MTDTFTLAHLSDPHLPPLPEARLRDLAGKRALGYLNWTRNRHKYHRREVLDALVADMQAQRPDHIAVTGDLVNLALEAEFPRPRPGSKASARRNGSRSFPATTTPMSAPPGIISLTCSRIICAPTPPRPTAQHFRSCAAADRWR